jgi:outer membrane PBP1 activator LpoA protein
MGLLACCALASVACSTPTPQDITPAPSATTNLSERADRLGRGGKHAEAAPLYEQLAAQSPAGLSDRLKLRAAREWLRAGNFERSTGLMDEIGSRVAPTDAAMRAEVAATLALRAGKPDSALAELARLTPPYPADSAAALLGLQARAAFALNRSVPAVSAALDRSRYLDTPEAQRENVALIWTGLRRAAAAGADFTIPPQSSNLLAGWLELGEVTRLQLRDPASASAATATWRTKYPNHPGNEVLNGKVQLIQDKLPGSAMAAPNAAGTRLPVGPVAESNAQYPTQIALLLPLSGRTQSAAAAVRDGFLAAALEQEPARRPLISIYDSAALGANVAYERAIKDGAQFVVGPLTKEETAAVAASGTVSVGTLALNLLPDTTPAPSLFYQFALDPEEEVRQIAQRIVANGQTRGLAFLPSTEYGQRIQRALDSELRALGGQLVAVRLYSAGERDFSGLITDSLLLDESRSRNVALGRLLGTKLEFEPRRRSDVQFIFVSAQPVQGRSLRPALRFHLGDALPIYAASDIFEPETDANSDLDGIIFADMPWITSQDEAQVSLRDSLRKNWPGRARSTGRLYAFGFDAFKLVPVLSSGTAPTGVPIVAGATGQLSIDTSRRVRRVLEWAQVANGKASALGTAPAAATSTTDKIE